MFTVVSQSTSLSVSLSGKTMLIYILTAPQYVNGSFLPGDGSLTSAESQLHFFRYWKCKWVISS